MRQKLCRNSFYSYSDYFQKKQWCAVFLKICLYIFICVYYKIHTCIYTVATYKITALWYVHIFKYILSAQPCCAFPIEGRDLVSGEQLQVGPTVPLVGPQQRWGSRCGRSRSSRLQALSLVGLVGSIWKLPAALPHPPCGTHAAFSVRVVKLVPLEATLWPELARLGLVVFEVGGSCGRQVLSQPYPMRGKSLEG